MQALLAARLGVTSRLTGEDLATILIDGLPFCMQTRLEV